jgi:C-terminal processing protease CtpA/Prc
MKIYSFLLILLGSLLLSGLYAGWDDLGILSEEDKVYGLSLIWKEADYNYPHFNQLPDLDWDAEYKRYIGKVRSAKDIYEYYRILQEFTALLQDCHTRVVFPLSFQPRLNNPLVKLKRIDGKIIVTNIGAKYKELLPIGSRIIEVDGLPVTEHLQERVLPYISASNSAVLYNKAMSLFFYGIEDSKVTTKFHYPQEKSEPLEVNDRVGEITLVRNRFQDKWSITPDSRFELLDYRRLDDEIMYVALFSFNDELIIRKFDSIHEELKICKGLIIDLRENWIGRTTVSNEILRYLTEQETITGLTKETRKNISLYRAWGTPVQIYGHVPTEEYRPYGSGDVWHREDPERIENHEKRERVILPTVILIGSETAMAAEDFLVALRSSREDVILVGTHTAGSRGQAIIKPLPGGGHVWISSHRDIYEEDQILNRNGIQPDYEIEVTYEDFLEGNDPVMEEAYRLIREKVRQ